MSGADSDSEPLLTSKTSVILCTNWVGQDRTGQSILQYSETEFLLSACAPPFLSAALLICISTGEWAAERKESAF